MENDTDKLIEEQLKTLPQSLREAINAVPWKSSIKEIAVLNDLSFDKVEIIMRETMIIIYGFDDPKNYIDNIEREAEIDEDTAISIAEAVNERILKPISLKVEELEKVGSGQLAVDREEPISPQPIQAAPPNLPMVEPGETVHDVAPATSTDNKQPTTNNVPTTEDPQPTTDSNAKHHYPPGQDPYREPLN